MNIIESNLKFNGEFQERSSINLIVLHHAAGDGTVEQIHQEHLNKGWIGIGYHFYVRKDGSVYRGRPEIAIGAHCLGYNTNSIGICAEGNFMNEAMQEVQKQALKDLIAYLRFKYTVDIKGHGELNATDCPGANYPLSELKTTTIPVIQPVVATVKTNVIPFNADVQTVQHNLNRLFNFVLDEDGKLGNLTQTAMENASKILGVTSLIDILNATNQILAFPRDNVPAPHLEYATRYIQYRVGAPINGIFEGITKVKVQNFQATHGLVADGDVWTKTWAKLME